MLGPKRLPDAGRSIGRGIREFKGAISSRDDDESGELRSGPVDRDGPLA